jgi:hypothetical protein
MTDTELAALVAQYRAGLEAEIALLRRLDDLSLRGHQLTRGDELNALDEVSDARDTVMAGIVTIESQMRGLRLTLVAFRERLAGTAAFEKLAALHREAAALATVIVGTDRNSLAALREAELARRLALDALEKSENTLAAYRRVIAPPLSNASLVDRKG